MAKGSNVTEEQCEARSGKCHERLDRLSETVNKIIGGVVVASVVTAMLVGVTTYYINYRFGQVDKKVEDIHNYLMPKRK